MLRLTRFADPSFGCIGRPSDLNPRLGDFLATRFAHSSLRDGDNFSWRKSASFGLFEICERSLSRSTEPVCRIDLDDPDL